MFAQQICADWAMCGFILPPTSVPTYGCNCEPCWGLLSGDCVLGAHISFVGMFIVIHGHNPAPVWEPNCNAYTEPGAGVNASM